MLMTKRKEILDRRSAMPFLPGEGFMMDISLGGKERLVCIQSLMMSYLRRVIMFIPYKRFVKALRRRKEKYIDVMRIETLKMSHIYRTINANKYVSSSCEGQCTYHENEPHLNSAPKRELHYHHVRRSHDG